jgi:hypothetical protein
VGSSGLIMKCGIIVLFGVLLISCSQRCKFEARIDAYYNNNCHSSSECVVRISELEKSDWDRVYIFQRNATPEIIQEAIGTEFPEVRAMGVKEFAARIGMESPNLLRAINLRHNPTQATIDRLLNPFGLKLSLALIGKTKRKCAA